MGLVALLITTALLGAAVAAYLHFYLRRALWTNRTPRTVGFFHPFTHDGGGGERVLWCAVRAVQDAAPAARCVIYAGDDVAPPALAARALERFGVQLRRPVEVVRLTNRHWVDPKTFPHFTLLGQSIGSLVLAWEALGQLAPAVWVDTAGYAFAYPLARLRGCQVACYTHYPTISTDMLARVANRRPMYNNAGAIASSDVLSSLKVIYYRLFAFLYGAAGRFASVVMVNSGWTEAHIRALWGGPPERIVRVYPPCDTTSLQKLPLERDEGGERYMISVAQFRPEKAHALQLEAFALAARQEAEQAAEEEEGAGAGGSGGSGGGGVGAPGRRRRMRLKLVGSSRNEEDEARVELLASLAVQLGIDSRVDFCVNVPYSELQSLLGGATAGLHTMTDEHFGISVVEYMAAGAIPIAHNSGGPKQDIVLDEDGVPTGFLATTATEFAAAILHVGGLPPAERLEVAGAARRRAARFSEANFDRDFKAALAPLLLKL